MKHETTHQYHVNLALSARQNSFISQQGHLRAGRSTLVPWPARLQYLLYSLDWLLHIQG
ncbi:hypothetical protein BN406_06037 (plasmid) [Sinorhizobium meliloti Rm41]|nr:hypothetical protein BN406_06037 [Sinorhizobium meliloti Rm41]